MDRHKETKPHCPECGAYAGEQAPQGGPAIVLQGVNAHWHEGRWVASDGDDHEAHCGVCGAEFKLSDAWGEI